MVGSTEGGGRREPDRLVVVQYLRNNPEPSHGARSVPRHLAYGQSDLNKQLGVSLTCGCPVGYGRSARGQRRGRRAPACRIGRCH